MESPLISAIVCTHNRAPLLDKALAYLADQTLPMDEYEVLIVDNASTDSTLKVAEKWTRRYPNFRYVYEKKLGLGYARNRGARESRAPIVAYIDDDAFAHPGWLEGILSAFAREPRPACVGGKILLRWEGGKQPRWLPDDLLSAYGHVDLGDQPRPMHHANGGNMAIEKKVLWRFGGFPTSLGRIGDRLLAGEESDLQLHLRQAGLAIIYEPKAIVEHWIPRSKQCPDFLYSIYYHYGISESLQRRLHRPVSRSESMKLIARALMRVAQEAASFATSLYKGKDWRHRQILWSCSIRREWGFICQELRFMLPRKEIKGGT